ncbi:hypothetical protein FQR65_LT01799 [Abscondita terminalis]|nr:hypothetical protein FQR65_LT01799 [Abscondita terminalis]
MEREHKNARVEVLLSCLIPVVGLSNFWRFPVLAYENGGGVFWYVYALTTLTIGISTHYLSLSLGQFTSACGVNLYSQFGVGFSGIAVTHAYSCFCITTYYSILSSRVIQKCEHGVVNWIIVICVTISNIIVVFYLSAKPFKMHKVCSALFILPSVITCAFTGIAASMPGGAIGIQNFFVSDFSYLTKVDFWFNAVSHCLFSMGEGLGVLAVWSSRNYFTMNLKWVSSLVTLFQVCQTCMIGMITSAVLSNLSDFNEDLMTIMSGSEGVPFIVYSVVLYDLVDTTFIVAITFFVIMYVIALLSIANLFYLGMTVVYQIIPASYIPNTTSILLAFICFLTSFMYATQEGSVLITLINGTCVPVLIVTTTLIELIVIMYFYGIQEICLDFRYMFQKRVYLFLRVIWGILLPITLILTLVSYLVSSPLLYTSNYKSIISWIVIIIGLFPIPLWMLYHICAYKNESWQERLKHVFDASGFGPKNLDDREAWSIFKEEELQDRVEENDGRCVRFLNSLIGK